MLCEQRAALSVHFDKVLVATKLTRHDVASSCTGLPSAGTVRSAESNCEDHGSQDDQQFEAAIPFQMNSVRAVRSQLSISQSAVSLKAY
jgi:hypothetical protein